MTEKLRSLSFDLVPTVTADLVVDDLSRLSESNKVLKACQTAKVKDIMIMH